MSEWTPYQTDHLFLLVGTNPLPNYIAALLLAKDNGTVHLLHSGGARSTTGIAATLQQAIKTQRPQVDILPREIDESDSSRVSQKMREILNGLDTKASVGLHYTGGTKAMAVHVYREIERVEKKFLSTTFSYLDARTLSLLIDGREGSPTKAIPVGQACEVKLVELAELHGRPLKPYETEAVLEHTYSALVSLHSTNLKDWREWCTDNLRRDRRPDKFKNITDLKTVDLPNGQSVLAPVTASLGSVQKLGDAPLPQRWKVDKLAEFLDGKWLEHYVLSNVKKAIIACRIHDYAMSVKPASGKDFEFDVAAMCGYQLFALSCTTDEKNSRCKEKLFEAYVRARQMGGDESQVALVCCHPDPSALEGEIKEAWFTEGRVRVFGIPHLASLPDHLREWINTANSVW
jgi:hypothetical protein